MAATLDPADLPKIAQAAGKSGKPLPDWAKGKPDLEAAHRAGAGVEPAPAEPTSNPAAVPPEKRGNRSSPKKPPRPGAGPPTPPGEQPPGQPRPKPSATRSPMFSPPKLSRGGTGGGLLLALVLYPIGLNVIKYGAKGPGMWFNAKFLNKVPGGGDWGNADPTAPPAGAGGSGGGDWGGTTPANNRPNKPASPSPAKPGQNTGTVAGPVYST